MPISQIIILDYDLLLSLPSFQTQYHGNSHLAETSAEGQREGQEIKQYLIHEEHQLLKRLLLQALQVVDERNDLNDIAVTSPDMADVSNQQSSESQVPDDVSVARIHHHTKRSAFDSIAHKGSFGDFGSSYSNTPQVNTPKKLEFTFKNLLPFLVKQMMKNEKEV